MRIIAGKYRGRRLTAGRGRKLRPTAARVREAIFSIIGPDLSYRRVLDLFAGSGAMGLEALSRGAASVIFVDYPTASLRVLRKNLAVCGNPANGSIVRYDLSKGLRGLVRRGWLFDLIFLDPPYGSGLTQKCLAELGKGELLSRRALVVSEHALGEQLESTYGCLQQHTVKRYGQASVSIYQRVKEGEQ
ncbi:MAG: 16S rRNA (guanine(966)-N(2))-methyltransferase RsmD [Deltaproteobacteria bacterium]|nr:16S rRNA (guanine(966)-N(2))-methyltransferase RsmD [Deltaproteobacteria bacterium]MBW2070372.1 16S rRNA (guanine(966)-N(2))-methyltransferase RsmD [Deltaproteobacteria bacterium]